MREILTQISPTQQQFENENSVDQPLAYSRLYEFDQYNGGYDPNGSDLLVRPFHERLDLALLAIRAASELEGGAADNLRSEAQDWLNKLRDEARQTSEDYAAQLKELSEHDRLYAAHVHDCVVNEATYREQARGFRYANDDPRNYIENIQILNDLLNEFEREGEDEKLIELAEVWRDDMYADLNLLHASQASVTAGQRYGLAA